MNSVVERIAELSVSVPEAERLFLGRVLQQPEKLLEAQVSEKHFLNETHKVIFRMIQEMEARNEVIDAVSVSAELKKNNEVNGAQNWLAQLGQYTMDSYTETFFYTSQKVLLDEYRKREIRSITHELLSDFNSDAAIQKLMQIDSMEKKSVYTMAEAAMAAIEKAQESAANDGLVGLPTNIKKLDEAIGGFQGPDLIVIGARPAMGKTSVALNFMLEHNAPVVFFSTEQPHEQIGLRAISATSGVNARKIRIADFEDGDMDRMSYAVTKLTSQKSTSMTKDR